ncbi:MAG: response regulator transcription factor [Acidobacteria bacterium]|nr:response regulator transcription factor [Acidobacteriota bacterium]
MRILVVEDERRMAAFISRALTEEACAVDVAPDGRAGLELARAYDYDAIVLDLMLPYVDGLSLCKQLRAAGKKTPVLVVSARDMVADRVCGLDAGADDYLTKPFAIEELLARLRALGRRQDGAPAVLRVGDLQLDPATRTARRAARAIALTSREYALLEYLMRRSGTIVTRTMIAEHVWDCTFDYGSNVVDVYVKHLRDKIDQPGTPTFIQAVRGAGYVLRDPHAADAES